MNGATLKNKKLGVTRHKVCIFAPLYIKIPIKIRNILISHIH